MKYFYIILGVVLVIIGLVVGIVPVIAFAGFQFLIFTALFIFIAILCFRQALKKPKLD